MYGGGRAREDRIHGALLVMAELLRCANADWERINRELEDMIPCHANIQKKNAGSSEGASGDSSSPLGILSLSGSEKHHSMASLGGAMRRYYQSGLNRTSRSSNSNVTQIPFNWFGSVPVGREQIVESALVSICRQQCCKFGFFKD